MADPHRPPIADYATPAALRECRISVGDYLFYFLATVLFMALAGTPMLIFDRSRRIFEDFKLKMPPSTAAIYAIHDLLEDGRAQYWIWLVPVLLPFLIGRLRRETRARLLLLIVLFAGFVGVLATWALFEPMYALLGFGR
jgi:hypothetical protein